VDNIHPIITKEAYLSNQEGFFHCGSSPLHQEPCHNANKKFTREKKLTTFETFKKHPILFLMGCSLTFTLTFIVMLMAGLAVGLKPDSIGKAMVGVVLVTFILGGSAFVKFVKKDRADKSTIELNTPTKRAILLLAPIGLFLIISYFAGYKR
jgi:uncharacterized membrane-anchored protein